MCKLPNDKSGMTLWEAAVAAAITLLALAGVASTLILVQASNRLNRETRQATAACQKEMDDLQSKPWHELLQYQGKKIYVVGLDYPEQSDNNGSVTLNTAYIHQNVVIATVTIWWKSGGKDHRIAITTLIEKK